MYSKLCFDMEVQKNSEKLKKNLNFFLSSKFMIKIAKNLKKYNYSHKSFTSVM